jgi:hypothetical protein
MLRGLRDLSFTLLFVAAPSICHSDAIIGEMTTHLGDQISVRVMVDHPIDSFPKALSQTNSKLSLPCKILNSQARCYEAPHSLIPDIPSGFTVSASCLLSRYLQ